MNQERLNELKRKVNGLAGKSDLNYQDECDIDALIDAEIARQSVTGEDRLTARNRQGDAYLKRPFMCDRCDEPAWSMGEITDRLCELEEAALRAFRKPTAEEVEELDRAIEELKRLRIALATARCDGMRIIDMLSPAIEILTALRQMRGEA